MISAIALYLLLTFFLMNVFVTPLGPCHTVGSNPYFILFLYNYII